MSVKLSISSTRQSGVRKYYTPPGGNVTSSYVCQENADSSILICVVSERERVCVDIFQMRVKNCFKP